MNGQRGRKSAASLSIVPVTGIQRPEPPGGFTTEEADVWRATVRAMKPNWFGPETHPLLSSYVFCAVICADLQARLRGMTLDHPDSSELRKWHRAETKLLMALARSLRLTPRSNRLGNDGRASDRFHRKPWELDDPA